MSSAYTEVGPVINALHLDGICTDLRRDLLTINNEGEFFDFNKIIPISPQVLDDIDDLAVTQLKSWGSTQLPTGLKFQTENMITYTTYDGHGLEIIRYLSQRYGNRTLYHAYHYPIAFKSYIVAWRNGEVRDLWPLSSTTPEKISLEVLDIVRDQKHIVTRYKKYDMVVLNCNIDGVDAETGSSRAICRRGDICIVIRVNYGRDNNPIGYIIHDTVNDNRMTVFATELMPCWTKKA